MQYDIFAKQVKNDSTQIRTFVYHDTTTSAREVEFCFWPIPWSDGTCAKQPVCVGDYLAYGPADPASGRAAEVYRITGSKFEARKGRLYYKMCFKCGCSEAQCECVPKTWQWHPEIITKKEQEAVERLVKFATEVTESTALRILRNAQGDTLKAMDDIWENYM